LFAPRCHRPHIKPQAEAGQARVSLPHAYDLFEHTLRGVQQVTVLSYTPQADTLYRQWRLQGICMGTHDLRIAALCAAHGAILISRNRQDVIRGPGLRVEFWE
jgi:tRNA(fMet)-specific endonuclease VapC